MRRACRGHAADQRKHERHGVLGGGVDVAQEIGMAAQGKDADVAACGFVEIDVIQAGRGRGDGAQPGRGLDYFAIDGMSKADPQDIGFAKLGKQFATIGNIGQFHASDGLEAPQRGPWKPGTFRHEDGYRRQRESRGQVNRLRLGRSPRLSSG